MNSKPTLKQALSSLGYRETQEGRWAKPVGYHLFVFLESELLWENWFRGHEGSLLVWGRGTLKPEDNHLEAIKHLEAYTRISVESRVPSCFELPPTIF